MDDDDVVARLAGAVVFLIAAAIALAAAWLSATMESDTSSSDPQPLALSIFSATNAVAAGLATVRRSTWPARFAGILFLAPAIVLLDSGITAGAVAIVLLGGALAGGLLRRPRARYGR